MRTWHAFAPILFGLILLTLLWSVVAGMFALFILFCGNVCFK